MNDVDLRNVSWVADSAEQFTKWLVNDCKGDTWTSDNLKSLVPNVFEWTVGFITYESLFEDAWKAKWFQDGIKAFALLAIQLKGSIVFVENDACDLFARCPDGTVLDIDSFLAGESLSYKYDSENSDLIWEPVQAARRVMDEYTENIENYPGY